MSFGLLAVAEAIRASYNGKPIPEDKKFTVATTGGVDEKTLSYIAMGTKNDRQNRFVKRRIAEIIGTNNINEVHQIIDILDRTTIGAGGTFMTKNYNDIIAAKGLDGLDEAKADLTKMARLGTEMAKEALKGELVANREVK